MRCFEVVEVLCEAIEARHTGCEIEVDTDGLRVVKTFSYACARDLLITDVLRAIASPDWRQAIADAQQVQRARIEAYEQQQKLWEFRRGLRLSGSSSILRPSAG